MTAYDTFVSAIRNKYPYLSKTNANLAGSNYIANDAFYMTNFIDPESWAKAYTDSYIQSSSIETWRPLRCSPDKSGLMSILTVIYVKNQGRFIFIVDTKSIDADDKEAKDSAKKVYEKNIFGGGE